MTKYQVGSLSRDTFGAANSNWEDTKMRDHFGIDGAFLFSSPDSADLPVTRDTKPSSNPTVHICECGRQVIHDEAAPLDLLPYKSQLAWKIATDALAMPNWNQDELICALTNIARALSK
jgi:hypothetical protein